MEKMRNLQKKELIISYVIAFLIVFSSWTIYYRIPNEFIVYALLLFWILSNFKYDAKKFSLFAMFLFLSLWYYRPMDFSLSGGGILRSFLISSFFLLDINLLKRIIVSIKDILVFLVAIGVVLHISGIVAGLHMPEIATVYSSERWYHVYPLLVYQEGLESIRFSSIFDEPGYLGTISALLLLFDELDFKKKSNIILFVGGMFTLSMAFYLIVAMGFVAYSFKNRSFTRIIYTSIVILLVSVIIIRYFPELFDIFLNRKEFDSGMGGFTSSRGGMSEAQFGLHIINNRPALNMLFGNGWDSPFILFRGNDGHIIASSTIYRLIFQFGYIGLFYLIIFVLFNTEKKFAPMLFSIAFIMSLYQRPQIFEPIYIIMLASVMHPQKMKIKTNIIEKKQTKRLYER